MFGFISEVLASAVESFDGMLEGTPPHQIALGVAAVYFLYNQYHNPWLGRAFRSRNSKTPTHAASHGEPKARASSPW